MCNSYASNKVSFWVWHNLVIRVCARLCPDLRVNFSPGVWSVNLLPQQAEVKPVCGFLGYMLYPRWIVRHTPDPVLLFSLFLSFFFSFCLAISLSFSLSLSLKVVWCSVVTYVSGQPHQQTHTLQHGQVGTYAPVFKHVPHSTQLPASSHSHIYTHVCSLACAVNT